VRIKVLLAIPDLAGESDMVAAWSHQGADVHVIRRCVDAVDLLGAVASGSAQTAIISPGLPRLGRDTVVHLANAGTNVVGVVAQGDDRGEHTLRDFRVPRVVVLPAGDVRERIGVITRALMSGVFTELPADEPPADQESGRIVTVWGPHGAPGRTCVAIGLADEIARAGISSLLVDADTAAASVALWLGMLDEASGIAIACRQAEMGMLDALTLAEAARSVTPRWRVITGLPRSDRWIEMRPAALDRVWQVCRATPGVTVIDVGAGIDPEADTVIDQRGPHRFSAAHSALAASDEVIAVGAADPLGMDRLIQGLQVLAHWQPQRIRVVVTRVRRSVLGPDPGGQVRAALSRYANVDEVVLIDDDRSAYDRCLREGLTLAEVAPRSAARPPLCNLANQVISALVDQPVGRSV
jgi:MinD-like ATPase involved in chromosome partitioning or flagellar assembly